MLSWALQTLYWETFCGIQRTWSLLRVQQRHREGMVGSQTGHLWGLSVVFNLLVEDSALTNSNDKVVKQGSVIVMGLSVKALNLWNPPSPG